MNTGKESKIYSRTRFCFEEIFDKFGKKTRNKNTRKGLNAFFSAVIILIVAIITYTTITKALNPIINEMCMDKAKNIATIISNEEATVIMDKYTYNDLITIIKDGDGNVKMLQTNTKSVNQIMSDIPTRIVNKFEEGEKSNITIYLGSVLGVKYFSARGPKMNIKIANVGNVDTKLESEFVSEGINQTLHRLYLVLTCEVTILTPYSTIKQKIENQVLIAESVIVGNVPDSYYNLVTKDVQGDSVRMID